MRNDWSMTTRLLNSDRDFEPDRGVSPAIMQSLNYTIEDEDHLKEIAVPLGSRFYGRRGNPTNARLARIVADMEGGEAAMVFASGMAATSTAMMAFLKAGDHVVGQICHYIGAGEMLDRILPGCGVSSTRVDQTSVEAFEKAIRPNTKMIVLETPVNPLMHVTDLRAVAELARSKGIVTFCDNTFATPINQRPIELGIDIVMHSASKYIGGHHDLLAGVLVSAKETMERIWDLSMTLGGVGAPFNSWLAMRGIRTMELRVRQHNQNALTLARHLEHHPAVRQVYYPGLQSHPQHALAARQMSGFGGLLTFDLVGGYEAGRSFIKRLKLVDHASSLGGVTSVAMQPSALFGGRLPEAAVKSQGLTPGMIRFATGIENTQDLVADVDQALDGL